MENMINQLKRWEEVPRLELKMLHEVSEGEFGQWKKSQSRINREEQ